MPQCSHGTYGGARCSPHRNGYCQCPQQFCRPPHRPGLWPPPPPCPQKPSGASGGAGKNVWLAAALAGAGLLLLVICLPPCMWIALLGVVLVAAGAVLLFSKK